MAAEQGPADDRSRPPAVSLHSDVRHGRNVPHRFVGRLQRPVDVLRLVGCAEKHVVAGMQVKAVAECCRAKCIDRPAGEIDDFIVIGPEVFVRPRCMAREGSEGPLLTVIGGSTVN